MLFTQAHLKFLNYLEVIKNKSQKTIEQYDRHLRKYTDFIIEKSDLDLKNYYVSNITLESSDEFRKFLYEKNRKIWIKTANAYMITLRSFLKYLEKKWIKSLSATAIDLIKAEQRHVEFLSEEELERLFWTPNTNSIIWIRDLAIMKCIYSTWLRVSELTSLNIENIDLKRKEFWVRWKWRKIRVVFLTDKVTKLIKKYLEIRNDHLSPLFIRHNIKIENIDAINDEKARLSRFFITNMIKKYSKKAFILKNVSAHTLRHSFATTLLSNWADLRAIQEMLWHSSITTTQVYTHVTNKKLKEVHKKFMK